jgi:hypothetical protein
MRENDEPLGEFIFKLVSLSFQTVLFICFLAASIYVLKKKWDYLDYFSKQMIIIHLIEMTVKLIFFIMYIVEPETDLSDTTNILKSITRAFMFLANTLFLMSL